MMDGLGFGWTDNHQGPLLSHHAFGREGIHRKLAQSGSAPALGAGGREFESLVSDQWLGLLYALRTEQFDR